MMDKQHQKQQVSVEKRQASMSSTKKKIPSSSSSSRGVGKNQKKSVRFRFDTTMQIVQEEEEEGNLNSNSTTTTMIMTQDEIKKGFYNFREIHNFKYDAICVVQQEIDRRNNNNEAVEKSSPSKMEKKQSPEHDDDDETSSTLRGLEHLLDNNGAGRKMNRTNAFKAVFEEQTRQRLLQQQGRDDDTNWEERIAAAYKAVTEESIESAYLIGLSDAVAVQQQQQQQKVQCRRWGSTTTRRISLIMIRSSIRKLLFSLSHYHDTKSMSHPRCSVLGRVSPFRRDTH